VVVALFLNGCATSATYYDVDESELSSETLWPGLRLDVEYESGKTAKIIVSEVTDRSIISDDGSEWPKSGIRRLTVKGLSNSSDCGSLQSWKNYQCWEDDALREIGFDRKK
jgi:hypothetical protein